ncbi:ArsC/Spx/MgsR family protein [Hirschia baltica]|uniref:Arsenate reductase and related n=1 Tax=Hirschia baltica (strain ATCC 49814 / DSM 5838 / IFAM 1418) TaxID=582402 RepID=C6XLR6_HIRBI|nr:ArsC/Spx/MgsR family protein [Hirschia baltica]ACT57972.1 arsenate reductase and related [Hirschia baltica ATCC 49814]
MTYILLTNPACSTCRNGLALLQENGIEPTLRKYMNVSEQLSVEELRDIAKKLGNVSPKAFARPKNIQAEGLDPDMDDDAMFAAMAENPKFIQRPILIKGDEARLGRPIEKMLELI